MQPLREDGNFSRLDRSRVRRKLISGVGLKGCTYSHSGNELHEIELDTVCLAAFFGFAIQHVSETK
jgi:hypothetical protein